MVSAIIKFIGSLLLTVGLVYVFNHQPGSLPYIGQKLQNSPAAMLPPLGKFLNPYGGFWQNAEGIVPIILPKNALVGLRQEVKVVYDDRLVPHIFAQNQHDLYFVQGYVTASHRLWQMEFQTHAAAGRVSEIVGSRAIEYDREQRRKGMTFAAEKLVEALHEDSIAHLITQAYTNGVNAYINGLSAKNLPVEYKLLNYAPEPWTTLKSALLMKKMADDLTGQSHDIQLSNLAAVLGQQAAALLYPDYVEGQDPIIPAGTKWNFIPIAPPLPAQTAPAKGASGFEPVNEPHLLPLPAAQPQTEPKIGSNNWAVSGSKTASGKPILCNDPHLQLNLPAIWYETHLNMPGLNVYGVTIPGGPGIVIGFNDHIAWGVTNAGVDVKDWYTITFKDAAKNEYQYNNGWKKTEKRIETIKVKFMPDVADTVVYTHLGPVVYENYGPDKKNIALHWQAHEPSNDLRAFYLLNRAKNYADYAQALTYYECPAQNFVFADASGDIAIWQKGKYPLRYKQQGKFVLDGNLPQHEWQAYIPAEHTPNMRNPERGFVSSANQHPTDPSYPYYYRSNDFEFFRNRRINRQLAKADSITPTQMQELQLDNYNLLAAESLPIILNLLKPDELDPAQKEAYNQLKGWDFVNNADETAPALFEILWQKLLADIWDELLDRPDSLPMVYPDNGVTIQIMKNTPDNKFMDKASTPQTETLPDLVKPAFVAALAEYAKQSVANAQPLTWANYKATSILHLARIDAFSVKNIHCGGNPNSVNATGKRSGPSWRMVVAFTPTGVQAQGVYPGGQTGNPGSPHYTRFVDTWAKGEYYPLRFVTSPDSLKVGEFIAVQNFTPILKN